MKRNHHSDVSILPKELKLLLKILNVENNEDIIKLPKVMFSEIDWELFLKLARHHRLYPLIYSKLNKIKIEETLIPHNIIKALAEEYKRNTFQMLQLSGEMEQISKLFSEKQIRLLFLKGPVIADDIYGDVSLRTSKDLDLLIAIKDLKMAEEILLNSGYEKEEEFPSISNEWQWMNHHTTYFHPHKRIQIEIHWRLHPFPTKEPSFNELWERKRTSKLTGSPIYFLGKEDLFSFLIVHGGRHGWFRLRWLVDIDYIIRQGYTPKDQSIFTIYNYSHFAGQAFLLASQLLETPIPVKMHSLIENTDSKRLSKLAIYYIIEMGYLHINKSQKRSIYFDRYLFSIMSNPQKVFFIIRFLYPKPNDVKTLKLPRSLHFLYFIIRPFLWGWRNLKKPI
ncbi:nucleotidyltransferase family protein [Priestia megaterium]|uniref:nucleotidyltransferase domain-containing protein n=1 Tax=Priestia megaterium TaxID=1404 RepID=UPI00234E79CB|nr:nucleotidyltransferase family protein [Priestia megaterium]MDC7783898.1 nucleotidyltransferase family protein [Priestia megaterium]